MDWHLGSWLVTWSRRRYWQFQIHLAASLSLVAVSLAACSDAGLGRTGDSPESIPLHVNYRAEHTEVLVLRETIPMMQRDSHTSLSYVHAIDASHLTVLAEKLKEDGRRIVSVNEIEVAGDTFVEQSSRDFACKWTVRGTKEGYGRKHFTVTCQRGPSERSQFEVVLRATPEDRDWSVASVRPIVP